MPTVVDHLGCMDLADAVRPEDEQVGPEDPGAGERPCDDGAVEGVVEADALGEQPDRIEVAETPSNL